MSETILKAMMQLFAIVAKPENSEAERHVVENFLRNQLNEDHVITHLNMYDAFVTQLHLTSKRKEGQAKRTSLNSVKILRICNEINQELEQNQKLVVLLRLMEMTHTTSKIGAQEQEFVKTVSDAFNIDSHEYKLLDAFVNASESAIPDFPQILTLVTQPDTTVQHRHQICVEGLRHPVCVVQVPSVGIYAIKLLGKMALILNGQSIHNDRIHVFNPGSSLRSAKLKPVYYSDVVARFLTADQSQRIVFEAKDISFAFPSGKLGLRNINIYEQSGKLVGIMGGSGAGKSTLLNVLNGNERPSQGAVCINGIQVHTQRHALEGVIGHISQDDLLIEELTVFENLFYNAKLCFGNLNEHDITKKCIALLSDLGLGDTRDLKVGSPLDKTISGGQRKRLNIALELIREPAVLFVDEPTSGLSSRDSENIMDLLKELALKGKLIFVVIHQPSSEIYKMFDRMIILDLGGYPIYYGNPIDAITYFKHRIDHVNADESECFHCGNVNPEQIFNIIESKVVDEYGNLTYNRKISPASWNQHYNERIAPHIHQQADYSPVPDSIFKIPGLWHQFKIFITRDVRSKLTNTQYLIINCIEAPLLAFILAYLVRYFNPDELQHKGYTFFNNENLPAYLFMSVVVALFIGLTVSAEEIIRDRKIRKRESFLNLSKGSYLWSKIIVLFVLSAVQTLTFILVGNAILGIKGMWTDYWFILFSASCFANLLGLNISSAFNSAVTIYILIPFLIIPQLLLAGVVVKFDKLNPHIAVQGGVPLTGEIMASRWAFEALAVNQFNANAYESQFVKEHRRMSIASYKRDYWIQKMLDNLSRLEQQIKQNKTPEPRLLNLISAELNKERRFIQQAFNQNYTQPAQEWETLCKQPQTVTLSNIDAVRTYLENQVKPLYITLDNQARERENQITLGLIKNMGNEGLVVFKEAYENEALTQLVKNTHDISGERCLEKDGRLIQQIDPVFADPDQSHWGRAHFFASRKNIFGIWIPTYWFNAGVIWSMTGLLMVCLYFDVFARILKSFSRLGPPRWKRA